MKGMQELMQKMQGQMNALRATTDPAQRQKLMQEHMATMQEAMKDMHGMGGGMGGGPKGHMTPDKRMEMMENRMDMMQMMMEQMMNREEVEQSQKK